jgi:hypothetical protein
MRRSLKDTVGQPTLAGTPYRSFASQIYPLFINGSNHLALTRYRAQIESCWIQFDFTAAGADRVQGRS